MTNEEKIRTMNRLEMAEAMAGINGLPEFCINRDCPDDHDCVHCAFDWLGEEAKDGKENADDPPYKILRRLSEEAKR